MSEEIVDRVRPLLAEWEQADFAAGTDLFAADAILSTTVPGEPRVVCHGLEEIGGFMRAFLAQWRDFRIEVDRVTPLDEATVFVEGRQYGTGRSSGAEVADSVGIVFRFEGPQIAALYWHPDPDAALADAGLSA